MVNRIGRKFIPALADVIRQFAPFHVISKLFIGTSFTDYYDPSGSMSTIVDSCLDDTGEKFQPSYTTSAFPGAHGLGIITQVASDIFNPNQGRFLPSSVLGTDGYFWSSTSTVTKEVANAPRNTGRRKGYKYVFPCSPFSRGGKSQPIALDFMSASGVNGIYGQNDPNFIPKGFSFSSQNFYSTKGSLSGIYQYEQNEAFTYDSFLPSSYFPSRAVPPFTDIDDFDYNSASSLPVFRDFFGSNIRRTLTSIKVRRGRTDRRWWNFDERNFLNFKFGQGMHKIYKDFTTKFNNVLNNEVKYTREYEGGLNIIAHAFGPIVFNHDFSWSGEIQNATAKYAFENLGQEAIGTSYPEWSAVVATAAGEGETYASLDKTTLTLKKGSLSQGAFGAHKNILDILESPARATFSNDSILSGVKLVSTEGKSFAVWNQKNSHYNIDFKGVDGITLVKRDIDKNPLTGVRIQYPLDGAMNKLINGDLKFSPLDINKIDKSLSAFAAWGLADKNRTPDINRFGSDPLIEVGTITPIHIDNLTPSSVRAAQFHFSGNHTLSGIGSVMNPSMFTIASPTTKAYPNNPNNVTLFTDHIFSLQASANSASWTPRLAIYNNSRDEVWDNTTSSWLDAKALDTTDWPLLDMQISGVTQAAGSFQYWQHKFTLSSNTGLKDYRHDQIQLWIHPVADTATGTVTSNIKDLRLFAQNQHNNRLFPEREYEGRVTARIARLSKKISDEKIAVRIKTHYRPLIGYGLGSKQKSFCYNFLSKMWEETDSKNLNQWSILNLSASKRHDPQELEFKFSTLNSRTPLRYNSMAGSDYFLSAGKVHAHDTGYYIEIAKPFYSGDNKAVTVEKLWLRDAEYANNVAGYEKEDVKVIFDFFADISNSDHSRSAFNSSSTFYVSGGSRSEYLEWEGGSHSAVDGIYTFSEDEG